MTPGLPLIFHLPAAFFTESALQSVALSLTPRLVQGLGTDQSLLLGLPCQAQGPGSALGHSAQPSWWHVRVLLGVRGESQGSP